MQVKFEQNRMWGNNKARFKKYGTPTPVTRLKFAPNMTDPISLNENLPKP